MQLLPDEFVILTHMYQISSVPIYIALKLADCVTHNFYLFQQVRVLFSQLPFSFFIFVNYLRTYLFLFQTEIT